MSGWRELTRGAVGRAACATALATSLVWGGLAVGSRICWPAEFQVAVGNGRATVKVDGAPLTEVLRELGAASGIEVTVRGAGDAGVSDAFVGLPLERAVRRLAGARPLLMIFAPGSQKLVAITVYGRARGTGHVGKGDAAVRVVEERTSRAPVARAKADRQIEAIRRAVDRGGEWAPDRLARILANADHPEVRRIAAYALGKMGGAEAVAALTEALADADVDADLRQGALAGLARNGSKAALAALHDELKSDVVDPEQRRLAVRTLARLANPAFGRIALIAAARAGDRATGDRPQ